MNVTITSLVGAILVIGGIVLVAVQLMRKTTDRPRTRGFSTNVGPVKFALKTTFPGLLVIALGVVLLVIAAITGK